MQTELKPCPFCGGKAVIMSGEYHSDGWEKMLIGCTRCDARLEAETQHLMIERENEYGQKVIVNTSIVISPGAVEQWNRRADNG